MNPSKGTATVQSFVFYNIIYLKYNEFCADESHGTYKFVSVLPNNKPV